MNRVLQAARLHVVHPLFILGMPWAIVLTSFAVNEAIWGFGDIPQRSDGTAWTGGVLALYITVAVAFLQSVTQLFPFAMGVGLSRRLFAAGTTLMALAQAVAYAVVLTLLTAVENATGGWGTGMHFFAPGDLGRLPLVAQLGLFLSVMLAFMLLGIAIGTVHKRWGTAGLYALVMAAVLAFGAAAVVLTVAGAWPAFGRWFLDTPAIAIASIYLAFAAVLAALLSWTGLRRAVP